MQQRKTSTPAREGQGDSSIPFEVPRTKDPVANPHQGKFRAKASRKRLAGWLKAHDLPYDSIMEVEMEGKRGRRVDLPTPVGAGMS